MNTSIQFGASTACLWRGLKMLGQPDLRQFVWLPLFINLAVYALGVWAAAHYFSAMLDGLIPAWLEWLRWLLWPVFALLLSVIVFFSFTLIANLIAAPFYGPLAEKVLIQSGIALPAAESHGILKSMAVDLATEVRRMLYFALRALPLLLITYIPGINIAAPFLWVLFGAWSLSLEYFSYPLEAQGMGFDQQRNLAAAHRLESMGFGGAVMLGLSIPVFNILIPPAAVIGATLYVVEQRQLLGLWSSKP